MTRIFLALFISVTTVLAAIVLYIALSAGGLPAGI